MRIRNADNVQIPSHEQVKNERQRLIKKKQWKNVVLSTIGILIVVASSAVLTASLFFPVLQVIGESMEPTLKNNDVLLLMKVPELKTGQLVGVRHGGKVLLKRVIGIPGDYISITEDGTVYVNNKKLDEPYVTDKSLGKCDITFPYQVPDKSYFVLGDHRSVSIDSRSEIVGSIRYEQIIGKAVFCVWPFDRIGRINGQYREIYRWETQ